MFAYSKCVLTTISDNNASVWPSVSKYVVQLSNNVESFVYKDFPVIKSDFLLLNNYVKECYSIGDLF